MTHDETDPTLETATVVVIRRKAMDLLARREHAPAELADKLKRRGFEASAVSNAIDQLIADDLVNEHRYAESVVANRSRRGVGPMRIRAELGAAGLDESTIESALGDAEIDWSALARAAREKRFGADVPVAWAARAKQLRFLQQRGFTGDDLDAAFSE